MACALFAKSTINHSFQIELTMKVLFSFSLILSICFLSILSKINHGGDIRPSTNDEKPRLFVFSVGPDADDLSYTSGDAVRVACTMESQVFSKTYGDCRVEGLFGEEAKAIRIIQEFKNFLSKGKLNERDVVIFYMSSHGYIDNGEMFIKASDFERDKETKEILGGVVSIKDVTNELKRYPCKKILLIDACRTHLAKDETPAETTEERQVNIYSSELGERSNEAEKLEAGLFTYVLLEGLKGEADNNQDSRIQLNELWSYLQDEVPSLADSLNTEKRQKPIMIEGDSVDNSIVLFEYKSNQSGYIVDCNVASPERIEKIANVDAELIYETQLIEIDSFVMGSPKDEECRKEEEKEHWVRLDDYAIGKYEVTNAQFCEFLNDKYAELSDSTTNSWIKIDKSACRIKDNRQEFFVKDGYADFPVVMVTWYGANEYAKWRSNDYIKYTLPTEAQWEYAAKGPDFGGEYWVYSGSDKLHKVSWHKESSSLKSRADVAEIHLLEEEVYGMSGNAAEWCQDVYKEDFYSTPEARKTNPVCDDNTDNSKQRVVRGGSYKSSPCQCRVASRSHLYPDQALPDLGFRLVRNVR